MPLLRWRHGMEAHARPTDGRGRRRGALPRRRPGRRPGGGADARSARRPAAGGGDEGHARQRAAARPDPGWTGGRRDPVLEQRGLEGAGRAPHRRAPGGRAGGRPPLIIATDQEGGLVRRIPWAPPKRSAAELGTLPASVSQTSGANTGAALHAIGINLDLAPVADVPAGPADFIEQQRRAFSTSRFTVASDAAAFAKGLEQGGTLPTLKHFPGLGLATVSTDEAVVRIDLGRSRLIRALLPYQVAFRQTLGPVVMLSTAIYPALDSHAAAWSRPIIHGLLRGTLGFSGTTITDSLDAAAAARGLTDPVVALRSAEAGADLLLVTGSQATSKGVYASLLAAAQAGALPRSRLTASYNRILGLKSRL